ncbi:E3 ubiquitin-protein ligase rfi2 [Thalictrum thalictroides]|uniref:E3 ubiquitin-protein ligase rfi2 n=1 Tax=Thalictrum thalictroides TaxID=46969 RepID=A0A7J6V551_THATH|nr:E3 ubiquitin-protein ligase rfi2 [Thalictrum thalictroides]
MDCDPMEDSDGVLENKGRSIAKLHCNHEFHLDCIGSAFNVKGVMQCPNCRKIEKGQWLFASGARSCPDFSLEDWAHDEDLYDPSYAEIPLGLQWCPYSGLNRLSSSFEEGEPQSTAYHDLMGHHAIFAEHTATPSAGHSCPYVAYFQLQPSSSNSNESNGEGAGFGHPWSGLSGPSEISTSHAFATVDLHYHSWDHHPPSFTSGTDQASVPPAALRSIRSDSDGMARSGSYVHPFLFTHGSGPRTGSSFISSMVPPVPSSISRTHERVQGLHAYHQVPPNSTGMRSPIYPSVRRSGAPRGMTPVGPVASSSDSGFVVFPPAGSSGRTHQEADNPLRNRFYAWERDRFAPFPLIPVDRESSWWGPFHQPTSGSDSNNRSSSHWHRHGSERTASQNRAESSSYQPVNPSARLHPFI